MSILITLGWIALLVGVILIIVGYTIAPRALHPGFGLTILGVVLLLIGYLIPAITAPDYHDGVHDTAHGVIETQTAT